jgi:hypothetical protein
MTEKKPKVDDTGIGWITVTYRSVLLAILAVLTLVAIVLYFAFPKASHSLLASASDTLSSWTSQIGGTPKPGRPAGELKASFTMLDGTVKVKKKNGTTWVTADYNLPLEKGDVIQTGGEGMAKIVFADLTNYTVKPDSLIVIEQNSSNADQQTNVAVQVTTGTVDLSTATYSQGSKSEVIVAGATATLAPDSAAVVKNDNRTDTHEVIVTKGSGEINRGGEVVSLSNFDKVSFKADSKQLTKEHETGPPNLIDPANMAPIFASGADSPIRFTWTPVDDVKGYHVRVSKNPYFTQLLMDKKVTQAEMAVTGIAEGAYYWSVQSIEKSGKESTESERNRFTIIPKTSQTGLNLELEPFVQHGRIIEVRGKTDSTARVMVNGGEVPMISNDGRFRYMTPPLPNGENVITVTAQNAKGGVSTQTKKVVIQ